MKFTEILKRNRELSTQFTGNEYKIALLSNITMGQLKEVLELTLREEGINANVVVGGYDSIVQDSSLFSETKAALVFWEACNLIDGFHNSSFSMSAEDLSFLAERVEGEIDLILNNLKDTPLVLINYFSSALFHMDILRNGPLSNLCKRLNSTLDRKVGPNQICVNLDVALAKVGLGSSVDFRQFQSTKALYTINFFKVYSELVKPAFMAATGRAKKILVLDCDNTLWGGIIGEDSYSGIQMSDETLKGKVFQEVQTILRGLKREGVLLALCSKNNLSDINEVLSKHPDMVLKNNDFAAKKINWKDKATNLRELAIELNLGLDSFLFVDDSAFEIGLIQRELPQVKCVQVPQNLSEYPSIMRELKQNFFNLSRTGEDALRTEMYLQEQQRKDQAFRFKSVEDYLASLDLKIKILCDMQIPVSRAAQMTQKTNQFNLTTRRYTEADILRMVNDSHYMLVVFSVEDRYGDYGATGMIIVRQDSNTPGNALIDSFLMSCRIIGRNIEYKIFDEVVQILWTRGINYLRAEYLRTEKNSQVELFYDHIGFNLVMENKQHRIYGLNLAEYRPKNIRYIEVKLSATCESVQK